MRQFNYRIGTIEARTVHRSDGLEIVQWNEGMCWVIVHFYQSKDTAKWNASFVEDRPFHEAVNWQHLRQLIQASYAYLSEVG